MTTVSVGRGRVRPTNNSRRFKAVITLIDGEQGVRDLKGSARTREGAIAKALGTPRIDLLNRDGDLQLARAEASGAQFGLLVAGREVEVFDIR